MESNKRRHFENETQSHVKLIGHESVTYLSHGIGDEWNSLLFNGKEHNVRQNVATQLVSRQLGAAQAGAWYLATGTIRMEDGWYTVGAL